MDSSRFDYGLEPQDLERVQWERDPTWLKSPDGKKFLVRPGDYLLITQLSGQGFIVLEKKIELH